MDLLLDKILTNIKQVFIDEDKYGFDKHIWEYKPNGSFIGDSVVFNMAENTTPPTFYFVISPYDITSKKAPQHALVFKDGLSVINTDYTEYAAMRTGAMDTLVLQALGISSLNEKKILMFGRGKTATWSVKFLKHTFADCPEITVVHSETPRDSYDISDFDIIICHTNAKEFVLSAEDRKNIKKGAIITNFISTESNTEVDPSFFDHEKANVVIDWKPNLKRAPEIPNSKEIIQLKELLNETKKLEINKKYSVFRFLGTPLQNLAVLKTLTS